MQYQQCGVLEPKQRKLDFNNNFQLLLIGGLVGHEFITAPSPSPS